MPRNAPVYPAAAADAAAAVLLLLSPPLLARQLLSPLLLARLLLSPRLLLAPLLLAPLLPPSRSPFTLMASHWSTTSSQSAERRADLRERAAAECGEHKERARARGVEARGRRAALER